MKKQSFKTNQGEFLLIDIPKEYLFKIHCGHLVMDTTSNGILKKINKLNNDPRGFIEVERFLSKLDHLTEDQADSIVNKMYPDVYVQNTAVRQIYGYVTAVYGFNKAKDCLIELLKSKGLYLFENPINKNTHPETYEVVEQKNIL